MLNVLAQAEEIARRHWPKSKKWKAFLIVAGIVAAILGIIALTIWFFVLLVKSLTKGGFRNKDLYFPRMRR